jgi:hypothetical protein
MLNTVCVRVETVELASTSHRDNLQRGRQVAWLIGL